MIRATLAATLGFSCLVYGQAGNVVSDLGDPGSESYEGSPADLYIQACRNPFGDFNSLTSDGRVFGANGLDSSLPYRSLVPTFGPSFGGQSGAEAAIDASGRIIFSNLYNNSDYTIIDDHDYRDAIIFDDKSLTGSEGDLRVVIAQTIDGQILIKNLSVPLCCDLEVPENFVSREFSAAYYSGGPCGTYVLGLAAIDQDGFIQAWTACADEESFLSPPNFDGFIDVKITSLDGNSLTGIGLTETGEVYMWGNTEAPNLVGTDIRSIFVGAGFFTGLGNNGTAIKWTSSGTETPYLDSYSIISFIEHEDSAAILLSNPTEHQATPETFTTVISTAAPYDKIILGPGDYEFAIDEEYKKRLVFEGSSSSTTLRISGSEIPEGTIRNCNVRIDVSNTPYSVGLLEFVDCDLFAENQFTSNWIMFAQSDRLIFRNCDFSNITFYGKETIMSGGINLLIENCELGNKRFYYEYLFGGGTGNTAPYSLNVHDCSFGNFDFEHPFESIFTFNETSPQFLNLKGTRFVNNNAVRGGCICFAPNASYLTCRITNGIFEHNGAVFGGAIYSSSTTIDISKATFIDNSSPNGGSIYSSGLTGDLITVSNCSFVAQQTAASEISVVNTDLKVEQSLFSGSPAGGYTNIFETTKSVVFSEGNTFCGNIESFDGLSVFDLGGNSFENSCEQVDCNANGQIDSEEIDSGLELDCDLNGILDSCEVAGDPSLDCDESGTLDSCDVENGTLNDCNQNQIGDACEITANPGLDSNADGIIDSCQCITDINLDGATDFTDIVQLLSCWEQEVDGVCAFADVDKDDAIGFGDLLLVLSGFGPC